MRIHQVIISAAVLMMTAGACSSDGDDVPKRPPISRALDVSAYADRACDLLPQDQATRLGYVGSGYATKDGTSDIGPQAACSRIPPESAILFITLYLAHDQLADQYTWSKGASIGDTKEPWMEPLVIADQPAVTLARSHKRPNRTCDVVVGLTDTQSLQVHTTEQDANGGRVDNGLGQGDGRACEHAIAVAEAIVRNLAG